MSDKPNEPNDRREAWEGFTELWVIAYTTPWGKSRHDLILYCLFGVWWWWQGINGDDVVPHGALGEWIHDVAPAGTFTWLLYGLLVEGTNRIAWLMHLHRKRQKAAAEAADKARKQEQRQSKRDERQAERDLQAERERQAALYTSRAQYRVQRSYDDYEDYDEPDPRLQGDGRRYRR